jgi:hypothetical protein
VESLLIKECGDKGQHSITAAPFKECAVLQTEPEAMVDITS